MRRAPVTESYEDWALCLDRFYETILAEGLAVRPSQQKGTAMSTETVEAPETVTNEELVKAGEPPVETPAVPILANLSDADPVTQATVPIANTLIEAFNAIATKNASKTKGVDEIAKDLVETSTDPKVVAVRAKRDELAEQLSKLVLDQAKAIKEESGEPDLEGEANALKAMKGVLGALSTFPDGKRVDHFLKTVVSGNVRGSGSIAASSGPKNDLSAVRVWAKANGFPDVKDRGRMSDDILEAFNKAHPAK